MLFNEKALSNIMGGIIKNLDNGTHMIVRIYSGVIDTMPDTAEGYVAGFTGYTTVLEYTIPKTAESPPDLVDLKPIFTFSFNENVVSTDTATQNLTDGDIWGALYAADAVYTGEPATLTGYDMKDNFVLIGSAGISTGVDVFRLQNETTLLINSLNTTVGETVRLDDVTFAFEDTAA